MLGIAYTMACIRVCRAQHDAHQREDCLVNASLRRRADYVPGFVEPYVEEPSHQLRSHFGVTGITDDFAG